MMLSDGGRVDVPLALISRRRRSNSLRIRQAAAGVLVDGDPPAEVGERELDNTRLMRLAGRFARRVKAWGAANGVPVIFCKAGERKHRIAEAYLASHAVGVGVFLVLVAKAPAPVWTVTRLMRTNAIVNIERRREYVNHYSFHIIDPEWGHVTIKMSGHPPFGAQIILNGHELVARQAAAAGIAFTKAGNCFTGIADPAGLARIADALSQDAAVGRLGQVCQRWIYSACLCFGLDLDEQQRSGFAYGLDLAIKQLSDGFFVGALVVRAHHTAFPALERGHTNLTRY
jgi:hypothetical protein